jgi:AcrR family transcriptional regulator
MAQSTYAHAINPPDLSVLQQARRHRIVKAAAAALRRNEYDEIQISDIARGAEVARGTIYRYFGSKDALYAEVLLDWSAPVLSEEKSVPGTHATVDRLRAKLAAIISVFERWPQFFKVFISLRASADPNATRLLNAFSDRSIANLAADFAELGDRAEDVSTMLWSIMATMLTAAIYDERPMADVYRLTNEFIDLVAPQLSPDPTREAPAATSGVGGDD